MTSVSSVKGVCVCVCMFGFSMRQRWFQWQYIRSKRNHLALRSELHCYEKHKQGRWRPISVPHVIRCLASAIGIKDELYHSFVSNIYSLLSVAYLLTKILYYGMIIFIPRTAVSIQFWSLLKSETDKPSSPAHKLFDNDPFQILNLLQIREWFADSDS